MHITKQDSKTQNWDQVKSWNYKLPHLDPKKSVVYAQVKGEHGAVTTHDSEWIYYIISGNGEFEINRIKYKVSVGDVITVPPRTPYNYWSTNLEVLEVVMFIDYWDN